MAAGSLLAASAQAFASASGAVDPVAVAVRLVPEGLVITAADVLETVEGPSVVTGWVTTGLPTIGIVLLVLLVVLGTPSSIERRPP